MERGVSTSQELARYLLDEWDIATLPGVAFGEQPEALRYATLETPLGQLALAYRDGRVLAASLLKAAWLAAPSLAGSAAGDAAEQAFEQRQEGL